MWRLEPAVKTKLIVSVKVHKESEINFQSSWKQSEYVKWINKQLDRTEKASLCLPKAVVWTNKGKRVESSVFTPLLEKRLIQIDQLMHPMIQKNSFSFQNVAEIGKWICERHWKASWLKKLLYLKMVLEIINILQVSFQAVQR